MSSQETHDAVYLNQCQTCDADDQRSRDGWTLSLQQTAPTLTVNTTQEEPPKSPGQSEPGEGPATDIIMEDVGYNQRAICRLDL